MRLACQLPKYVQEGEEDAFHGRCGSLFGRGSRNGMKPTGWMAAAEGVPEEVKGYQARVGLSCSRESDWHAVVEYVCTVPLTLRSSCVVSKRSSRRMHLLLLSIESMVALTASSKKDPLCWDCYYFNIIISCIKPAKKAW